MVKGIKARDVLQSLPLEQRKDFANRLKAESGVSLTFTVAEKGRKRKHRWNTAQGRVVSVRFPDNVYASLLVRSKMRGLSVGDYIRFEMTRSHHKRKGVK